jgi:hypothetical protein
MNDTPKNGQPTYAMLVNAMLAKMSDRALIAENQLTTVTEQRDEARRLAEKYRNLSCDSQDEADETLLPWETTKTNYEHTTHT